MLLCIDIGNTNTVLATFEGENAQHLYSVRFDSHELWGPDAEDFRLNIDLWESHLEAAS